MGYRIRYGKRPFRGGQWCRIGALGVAFLWCAAQLSPVWQGIREGLGLYDALARFVGGMIRGAG